MKQLGAIAVRLREGEVYEGRELDRLGEWIYLSSNTLIYTSFCLRICSIEGDAGAQVTDGCHRPWTQTVQSAPVSIEGVKTDSE